MSTLVVDYAFNGAQLNNPDGSLSTASVGCTVVPGPGATVLGNYTNALSFGAGGKVQVDLPLAKLSTSAFCVRTLVKIDTAITSRQNLIESAAIPLSLFLDVIPGSNDFQAVASVSPKNYGWTSATTQFAMGLKVGTWYTIDLLYDNDTLGIAIDGNVFAVVAFPDGTINAGTAPALFIGTWIDGAKFHFSGSMAALQLHNGIPDDLEALLDERRNSPEWYITYRYLQLKPTLNLGTQKGAITYDAVAGAYTQLYSGGLLMYSEGIGTAYEMHGAIFTTYESLSNKSELGFLVSNEMDAKVGGARKNLFSQGAIYWSGGTGAVPVLGHFYIDYEAMGEAGAIGLPTAIATVISGGKEQIFQGARMYLKNSAPKAFEVHGDILAKFLSTGGVTTWGYPITNEFDIKNASNVLGRASEFENCTIYWRSGIGAHEVHGSIRDTYIHLGGAVGQLGFPSSDEQNVPGASAPARCNSFQNGSLFWFGGGVIVCNPYKIFVGRFDTKNSEGFGMGQNDLYFRITIKDNGHQLLSVRYPGSGDYGGHDVLDFNQQLPLTITPNNIASSIEVTFDVWESDNGAPFGGGDDHMGTYSFTLNAANAWGMRTNNGVLNSGPFGLVNSISWAVQPIVNIKSLTDAQRWWGVTNRGTDTLTYHQYAAAFSDVDPSPGLNDPQNWIADGLQGIFYLAVVKGLASGGNCFGMSLEAIYSLKSRSLLSMPISGFTDWNIVVDSFNVKHEYQVGSRPIWWFVGQFLSGETHDPVNVFQNTRDAFNRGDNPVLCIAQNYDFSGAPHCLMPIGWDTSTKPWKLQLCDPNFIGQVRNLLVDPDANTFSYDGGSNQYNGGAWSGGRMHYQPYSLLNDQERTPIWDVLMLLLSGTIFIIGSDSDTVSLTDENGIDLNVFGADAVARLKEKKPLDNKLVGIKGFSGSGPIGAHFYARTRPKTAFTTIKPGLIDSRIGANITLGDLAKTGRLPSALQQVVADPTKFASLAGRDMKSIANDPKVHAALDPAATTAIGSLTTLRSTGANVHHQLRGNKPNGQLQYLVKNGFGHICLSTSQTQGQVDTIMLDDFGTSSAVLSLAPSASKIARIYIENRIGVNDRIHITIDKLVTDETNLLKVNIKPGLGGVDILSHNVDTQPEVTVQTLIDGKLNKLSYVLPFGGNMRIRPLMIAGEQSLKVSRIDSLFGPLRDSVIIKPKA